MQNNSMQNIQNRRIKKQYANPLPTLLSKFADAATSQCSSEAAFNFDPDLRVRAAPTAAPVPVAPAGWAAARRRSITSTDSDHHDALLAGSSAESDSDGRLNRVRDTVRGPGRSPR